MSQQGPVKEGCSETMTLPSLLSSEGKGCWLWASGWMPWACSHTVNCSCGLSGLLETNMDAPNQETETHLLYLLLQFPMKGLPHCLLGSANHAREEHSPSRFWRTAREEASRSSSAPNVTLCTLTFTLGFGLGNVLLPLGS